MVRHRSITRTVSFRGNARFELLERIGSGGMGIVYRALDRERGAEVALKTLASASAKGIFRFKQEFRALADVAHPNLVSLHELFFEDDQWFFTMELVEGVDFLSHVCGRPAGEGPGVQVDSSMETVVDRGRPRGGAAAAARVVAGMPPLGRAGIGRLRNALRQLVAGITALHESGHLHQDIKPSNVIVTDAGRLVILDFGVVAALADEQRPVEEGEIVGTPAYMAPEQATDAPPTTASDWYGVGVMLYHALAGRLPFSGSEERILREKRLVVPSPVRLWRPEVPEDLDRLCMALLDPRPEQRPSGADVLARIGPASGEVVTLPQPRMAASEVEPPLVGRDRELAALREARERVRPGAPVAVHVSGTSGMGKSALVRAFLDEVRRDPRAVILAGRCYERESVPYKAVDTVIDALCQYLLGRSEEEVAAIAPADAALLGTMFPVLRRIDAFAGQVDDELLAAPHRLRRRAFGALRAMLAALAAERPLVVFIDDLQWGDADSAALLDAVLEPPEAPGLLLLGCYRSEERLQSGFLRRIAGLAPIEVPVAALPEDEALAVARTLLAAQGGDEGLAGALAAESGGNPFFLHELVRFVAVEPGSQAMPSLDALIERRVDRLGEDARGLVQAIAVAGRPIEQRVARVAGGIAEGEWPALVQRAAAARLLRISGSRSDDLIECYHDRIRETVAEQLAASELARTHRALAVALEDSYRRDPETVAEHFAAAGDPDRAAHYALQAADLAAAALAFDRAASLYRRALELEAPARIGALAARRQFDAARAGHPAAADERLAVRVKMAAALVNAGRGADAAAIYLDAAGQSSGDAALELRRLGAEHYLRSGHVDDGMKALEAVLGDVGLRLPRSARRSVPGLLWRRLRLRLRGLEASAPGALSGSDLARLEVCRTAMLGLSLFDPVRAAVFSTRHLHLALDSGDPYRIAFALAIEAGFTASARSPARANQLLGRADSIAREVDHPLLIASVGMLRGIIAYERGDFREAFLHCDSTEELVRRHLTGMSWELRTLEMFSIHSLFFLGDFGEILRRVPRHVADARDRGDLYAIMYLRSLAGPCTRAITQDDVGGAEEEIAEVEARFPGSGFFLQHLFVIYSRTFLDLYAGEPERAHRRMRETLPRVRASMLLHDRSIRAYWTYMFGATALGAAAENRREAAGLLRSARRAARALDRDGAAPCAAMARLLEATAAHLDGRDDRAAAGLELAAAGFDGAEMKVFAACARLRLGGLLGGTRGDQLVAAATEALTERAVPRPERGVLCIAPGFA